MTDLTPAPVNKSHPSCDLTAQFGKPVIWLRSEFDRLDDFGKPTRSVFRIGPRLALAPALELIDDETSYRITAELSGPAEKDFEISVAGGVLSISGEQKVEDERKDNCNLLSERRYSAFQRQSQLPAEIDPNAIKANFKNGVLTVTMTKDEKASSRTRKIAIEKA